jgi:hypothetical protein
MNIQGDFMRELLAVERKTSYFRANDDVGSSTSPGESHVTKRCVCVCVEYTPF